jgi:AcrR family transcriptional regulator
MAVSAMSSRSGRGGARTQRAQGKRPARAARPGSAGIRPDSPGARPGSAGVGAGQERISAIQRTRMLNAMVEVACERGAARVSVAHVVARAGISRRTFYELFEDREDCFIAAFDYALARAADAVVPAFAGERVWRERVRAGLSAFLGFVDEEPGLGSLLVVDALNGGPRALERRARLLDTLVDVLDGGRGTGAVGREHPPLVAEGVLGAVFNVIHTRMLEQRGDAGRRLSAMTGAEARSAGTGARGSQRGDGRKGSGRGGGAPFMELLNPLMSMIVMPYLGTAAARRELDQPAPAPRAVKRPVANPLRDLDMRLTYRTVRVLIAVASNAGASNRQIAEVAGVADQGQISKLLTRLEHLGLIENVGEGPARGEPNAWNLTVKGAEVEHAISAETSDAAR